MSGVCRCGFCRANTQTRTPALLADGSFLVTAGIGSVLRLEVKWNNHTFSVAMPDGITVRTRP